MSTPHPAGQRVTMLLPSLAAGGVARVALSLAAALLESGRRVDLVLCRDGGPFRSQVPAGVAVVALPASSHWRARWLALAALPERRSTLLRPVLAPLRDAAPLRHLPALIDWLREARPELLIAAKTHTNLLALFARRLAGVDTRVVVSQHALLSAEIASPKGRKWRWRHVAPLIAAAYPGAAGIVAVSDAVADDLAAATGLPRERLRTVHNPIAADPIALRAREPLLHPWFADGAPPVVLGVGRLRASKDFATLLRAFALLRAARPARLLLLGDGAQRAQLEALAQTLGIADDFAAAGFVENPFAYMARAGALALCSRYEAFGNVLLEALACGCPVVSTDCPGGPAEALEGGRFGRLVAVGDASALAKALRTTLDSVVDREPLRAHARSFSPERAARQYLAAGGL